MEIIVNMQNEDFELILEYCKNKLPEEACGLLFGRIEDGIKKIKKVYLLRNADASSEHFSMEPEEQLAAIKEARTYGLSLLGNFHSHTCSPAIPSEEDKRLAYDEKMEYLILSLQEESPVLEAFGISGQGRVTRHRLVIQ